MKKTHYITTIIPAMLIANVLVINIAKSQEPPSDVIKRAMKDELSRNISNLTLEGVQKPYFISYTICDAKTLRISATLGSLISSVETPVREHLTDVFVGDYQRDNQNFFDINILAESYQENSSLPLDNDYFGIRRGLWLSTDKKYKAAAELLEAKLSAIKQQNLSEEEASLPDFSKATTVVSDLPSLKFNIDKSKWENIAKELSTAFKNYKNIYSSNVSVFIYQSDIYFLNSEGTETKVPFTIAAVRINAQTQADDGEPLADHLLYYSPTPDDLPSIETMKNDVKIMADNLLTLRNAPVFNDSYTGPVLFENQAVAEVFAQQFFSGKSCLIAKRKPVYSDPKMLFYMGQLGGQSMDDKIGKPLVSKDMNIKSTPFISDFEGTKLIGSYQVDGDGVKPATELVLIENGTLKNLLNDRTPTPKIRESNGHKRLALQIGGGISTDAGPGIININAGKGMTPVKLKKTLLSKAKSQGLDYAIIVRKLQSTTSGKAEEMEESSFSSMASGMTKEGTLSKPIQIYKIYVADGREELVRSTQLGGVGISAFKNLLGVSGKQFAYNTLLPQNAGGLGSIFFMFSSMAGDIWSLAGIPASFIVPDAVLLDEVEVQQEKRPITIKKPVVENPVGK